MHACAYIVGPGWTIFVLHIICSKHDGYVVNRIVELKYIDYAFTSVALSNIVLGRSAFVAIVKNLDTERFFLL